MKRRAADADAVASTDARARDGAASRAAAREVREKLEHEHWQLMAASARAAILPTALLGALYSAYFWHYAQVGRSWMWWGALLLALAATWVVVRGARIGSDSPPHWHPLTIVQFLIGVLWGVAPLIIAHTASDLMLLTALVLATGVAVTACSSYASRPVLALATAAPIACLSLLVIARRHDPTFYVIGGGLLLLYAQQLLVLDQARRARRHQLTLSLENALLARQLSAHAERTAAELERRIETERILRASRDRAERLSATDALTELANRRYFDKRLKAEVSRSFRERAPLSLVLADVDYFKQFNDRYGHQQGDAGLQAFARVLESFCRRGGDLAARVGGEEFALLLPATDHTAALKLAEKVRAAFEALAIAHADSSVSSFATASFGVSTLVPDHLDDGQHLMRDADRALYRAKARGRNTVDSALDLESPAVSTG